MGFLQKSISYYPIVWIFLEQSNVSTLKNRIDHIFLCLNSFQHHLLHSELYIITLTIKFSMIYTYLYKLNNSCVSRQLLRAMKMSRIARQNNLIKPTGGIHFQFLEIFTASTVFKLVISLVVSKNKFVFFRVYRFYSFNKTKQKKKKEKEYIE